jgi:hypothetical protein
MAKHFHYADIDYCYDLADGTGTGAGAGAGAGAEAGAVTGRGASGGLRNRLL